MKTIRTFPHEGGCPECCELKVCNYCGERLQGHCTNGRCYSCHRNICTSGGVTSSGHNYGHQGGSHFDGEIR